MNKLTCYIIQSNIAFINQFYLPLKFNEFKYLKGILRLHKFVEIYLYNLVDTHIL